MTITEFKSRTVSATEAILKAGPDTIAAIESAISANFPYGADLAKVEDSMTADLEANG